MHRFSLWVALAGLLLWAGDAFPRVGATLVALITTDPTAELSHRVEEQLEALGFDVVVLNPPATGSVGPTSLEQTARNVGAIAAVRIVPMAQSVQVWTADPVSGQSVFRETLPGRATRAASIASKVSAGSRRLIRSRARTVAVFESGNMAPLWRLPALSSTPMLPFCSGGT